MNNTVHNIGNDFIIKKHPVILSKKKIFKAYYPFPEYKLRFLINKLLKQHDLSKRNHTITNKIWYELVDLIGEPVIKDEK